MSIEEVCAKAEKAAKTYNPEGLAPFPFEKITKAYADLKILSPTLMPEEYSGAIIYQNDEFYIFINRSRPEKRQYFTIAHELAHYFLHQSYLKNGNQILDKDGLTSLEIAGALYRPDSTENISHLRKSLEIEANNFAASLIMPEKLVRDAWQATDGKIHECAKLFRVSTVAMSVRLERLGLVS